MTKIIALMNRKGGVGKSTLATTLAAGLAEQGLRIVLADTDPQGNIADWFNLHPKEPNLYHLMIDKWDIFDLLRTIPPAQWATDAEDYTGDGMLMILPGSSSTADIDQIIVEQKLPPSHLRNALAQLQNRVHYVILDSNPTITEMTTQVIVAADYAIVPTETRVLATRSTFETIQDIRQFYADGLSRMEVIGVVPNKHSSFKKHRRINHKDLLENFGDLVWPPLAEQVSWEEAPDYAKTIFAYDPKGKATKAARTFISAFKSSMVARGAWYGKA